MFVRDPKRLAPYVQQLKEYFTGTRRVFDVPIDISEFGTEFQRRVLQAVQRIPYGMTISYGGAATSMPDASSYRSVEHDVSPVLFFIPDHRIVLSNNQVGTYRLGRQEKIRLIKLEKSHLHGNS